VANRCRVCASENRRFIEDALSQGASKSKLLRILKEERGETLGTQNFYSHLKHWSPEDRGPEHVAELLDRLRVEAESAPPTVAAFYYILIHQMKGLDKMKADPGTAIKAAEAITRVTGMRQQQQILLAFASARFGAPPPLEPVDRLQVELERVVADVD